MSSSSSSSSSTLALAGSVSVGLTSFSSNLPDSISVFTAGAAVELDSAMAAAVGGADELCSGCREKIRMT
jgi:hypothetical protein